MQKGIKIFTYQIVSVGINDPENFQKTYTDMDNLQTRQRGISGDVGSERDFAIGNIEGMRGIGAHLFSVAEGVS